MSTETLDLVTAGWRWQSPFDFEPQWAVAEDERELGNVSSTAVSERCLRRWQNLQFFTNLEAARGYVVDFFRRHVGAAGRFYFRFPEHVESPSAAPTLSTVSGGTQGARSITAKYAWKNTSGTTLASPEGTISVPASSLLVVTLPIYPPSTNQAVIYAAEDSPGNEQQQTILTLLESWTQPNTALLTGTPSVSTANTAIEVPLCKLSGNLKITRGDGRSWYLTLSIDEVYAP